MSDIKTTEGVKDWIKDVTWLRGYHGREEGPSGQIERRAREAEYTETAAKIALAMRCLAIVEQRADGDGHCVSGGCTYCPAVFDYCKHILEEAKKESKDE